MTGFVARHVHFLAALAVGCVVAMFGAVPSSLQTMLPRGSSIDLGDVMGGVVTGAILAGPAFWIVGRWAPLQASLMRTVFAGIVAALAFVLLLRIAAQVTWLTGDGAIQLMFLGLATLGFLPFAWPDDPQVRSFREDLPWRGRT